MIPSSELPLNADGSIYHLHIHPEQLADTVILVGDPGRVAMFSAHFDSIEHKQANREITTHTGRYKGKRCTVLSTGMGTDNLDIVVNELDALVNVDLKTREVKPEKKSLNLIRIGTCGSLQADIEVDRFIASEYALGMDGLMNFYKPEVDVCDRVIEDAFCKHTQWPERFARPYFVKGSEKLLERIAKPDVYRGITATASGFYGPQGRVVRLPLAFPRMHEVMHSFDYNGLKITNMEMECSALYGLGQSLGHETMTVCLVVANRVNLNFSEDYKQIMQNHIDILFDRILL